MSALVGQRREELSTHGEGEIVRHREREEISMENCSDNKYKTCYTAHPNTMTITYCDAVGSPCVIAVLPNSALAILP